MGDFNKFMKFCLIFEELIIIPIVNKYITLPKLASCTNLITFRKSKKYISIEPPIYPKFNELLANTTSGLSLVFEKLFKHK
jgi:hypothetical protein